MKWHHIILIEFLLLISNFIVLYYRYGALAQLGARNIRIVKATGSIPVCSTFCELPKATCLRRAHPDEVRILMALLHSL